MGRIMELRPIIIRRHRPWPITQYWFFLGSDSLFSNSLISN
jgi:hypothetical protein